MTALCSDHKPAQAHLIKATLPFERLNTDFKEP